MYKVGDIIIRNTPLRNNLLILNIDEIILEEEDYDTGELVETVTPDYLVLDLLTGIRHNIAYLTEIVEVI